MSEKRGMRRKGALCAALLAALLLAVAPISAGAAENPLSITVEQIFSTTSASVEDTFAYMLKVLSSPMSGDSPADYPFTIEGTADVQVGPLSFTRPGVYRYEMYQTIVTEEPGYSYDRRVYTIEVHVDAELRAEFVVRNGDGSKADAIVFANSYGVLPSDPELMVDPPVKKTVSDSPSKDGTFTFKLTAGDISNPMPAGSANGVKTMTIVGSGEEEFGTWSYDKAGVYYYTVSEVNAGETGYTYDTAMYTITDMVKDENGQLTVSRVVTNDANKQVTTMGFINKYSGSGGSSSSGPKTGDGSNTSLYIILLSLGGALAVGAAVYLIVGGKRRKANRAA